RRGARLLDAVPLDQDRLVREHGARLGIDKASRLDEDLRPRRLRGGCREEQRGAEDRAEAGDAAARRSHGVAPGEGEANLPAAGRLSSRARRGPALYIYRSMATTAAEPKRKVSADEAREVAEAAREQEWAAPSFVRDLFLGTLRMNLIHPYPEQDPEEIRRAQPFLEKLERLLRETVDSDRIDRESEIPDAVIQELRELGAFGIKIPREYGGLGLSQLSYMKAIELVSSVDGSLTALLSAHQSIGLPQPLKLFGTDAQKKKYFPRLATGAISAFALTEASVGSDPAAMETTAILDDDDWVLNGEKLWCTNGTKAELLVVIART